ncbi:chaplin [Actinospica durhamensis]|uniref:Chaplin n=1 Tax=Actinospica durhamensis TaxID=1508375 RepID=A0A941ET96_9ACTN|nr:chaplin [Actinospica durhamensis]MBR7836881.1 chaplin [Actinospica durhamensis]
MNVKKIAALTGVTGALVVAGASAAMADSSAHGFAADSPGILSGNNVQAPIHIPVNVTGNSISVIGLLDSAFDNQSWN